MDGEKVRWSWGKREIIYLSLHCQHQNDSCIMMGSGERHFNVSVENDGQSHKTVSTNHNLFEEKGEPKRYRTEVLPLTSLTSYRQAKPALIYLCNRSTYLSSSRHSCIGSHFTKPVKSRERLALGLTLTYTSAISARLVCDFTDRLLHCQTQNGCARGPFFSFLLIFQMSVF